MDEMASKVFWGVMASPPTSLGNVIEQGKPGKPPKMNQLLNYSSGGELLDSSSRSSEAKAFVLRWLLCS